MSGGGRWGVHQACEGRKKVLALKLGPTLQSQLLVDFPENEVACYWAGSFRHAMLGRQPTFRCLACLIRIHGYAGCLGRGPVVACLHTAHTGKSVWEGCDGACLISRSAGFMQITSGRDKQFEDPGEDGMGCGKAISLNRHRKSLLAGRRRDRAQKS